MPTLFAAALLAATLFAADPSASEIGPHLGVTPNAGPTCTGGVAVDDGTFENGYRFPFAADARYVQKLTPPELPALISRVCASWSTTDLGTLGFSFVFYDDDGPAGSPGTLLGVRPAATVSLGFEDRFIGVDCAEVEATIEDGGMFVGVSWNAAANVDFFISGDESAATPIANMYRSGNGGASWTTVRSNHTTARALGIRGEFVLHADPEPPEGDWLTAPTLPGYQVKALITAGATTRQGTLVDDCIVNTLCVAGAIASQPEIFVRVVGPKPNGYLWPTIIKFNTSQVEIWIERLSDGERQYYKLNASTPDGGVLPGLFDNQGFLP